MLELQKGRPIKKEGRLEKELRVYDLLDQLGIAYERIDHEPAETMAACEEIDAALAPAVICKNLFLCNTSKTDFYLLLMEGSKKFKTKEVSKQIGAPRLSFAPAEYMEEFLDITPGSVSIMGLMNDRDHRVRLLVDEDVARAEYVGCHPCINTSSLRIKSKDLFENFLQATGHDLTIVKVGQEEEHA